MPQTMTNIMSMTAFPVSLMSSMAQPMTRGSSMTHFEEKETKSATKLVDSNDDDPSDWGL